jgi:hypothetical protein
MARLGETRQPALGSPPASVPQYLCHDGFRRIEREQPDPLQGNLAGYDAQGLGIRRFRTTRS